MNQIASFKVLFNENVIHIFDGYNCNWLIDQLVDIGIELGVYYLNDTKFDREIHLGLFTCQPIVVETEKLKIKLFVYAIDKESRKNGNDRKVNIVTFEVEYNN